MEKQEEEVEKQEKDVEGNGVVRVAVGLGRL